MTNKFKRIALASVLAVLALLITPNPATALSGYLTSTNATNPGFRVVYPNSTSGAASPGPNCAVCHTTTGGGCDVNAYGNAWAAQHNIGITTLAAFRAVENLNSDNDPRSANNLVEINAGAQPGWTLGPNNTLYQNDGTSTVTATNQNPPSFTGLVNLAVSRDSNLDARADILWRNTTTGDVVVWLTNATGNGVASVVNWGGGSTAWIIEGQGDLNKDGRADILWRNTTTGDVVVWMTNATGNGVASVVNWGGAPTAYSIAGVGDLNGDGRADILWRNTTTGDVVVWLTNSTSTGVATVATVGGAPLAWSIAGVGDTNGDGWADILWRNTTTGDVVVWLMNGTQVLNWGVLPQPAILEWTIAGVGDANGDGKADLIWRHTSGNVVVWLLNGLQILSTANVGGAPVAYTIAGVGDVNGDGRTDIVFRNDNTGAVVVWLMNATGNGVASVVNWGGAPVAYEIQPK